MGTKEALTLPLPEALQWHPIRVSALIPGHTCFSVLASLRMDILEMDAGGAYLHFCLPFFPRATGFGNLKNNKL